MPQPKKILAIKLRSLGDTVLMTAPLRELRRAYPSAKIHVLVSAPWAPILENHPAVDQIIPYHRHSDRSSRAKAVARLAFRLRRERYDCVVNFHASPSSALIAWATGAKVRSIHFHGHESSNRYSTVTVPGKGILKPIIERDMDTVRALGIDVPLGKLPQVKLLPEELRAIESISLKSPTLGIGIGAGRPTKSWPLERFVEVAHGWMKNGPGSVVIIAGPGDQAQLKRFKEIAAKILIPEQMVRLIFADQLSLRELAAFITRFKVLLSNDSGPKHIAVAVGTSTVTLFGPEHPFEWHPYSKQEHPYFFVENLHCRRDGGRGMPPWCAIDPCIVEKHRCMTDIAAAPVLKECLGLL